MSDDKANMKRNLLGQNLDAIRSVGANVLAMWSKEEIGDTGWKSGKTDILLSLMVICYMCYHSNYNFLNTYFCLQGGTEQRY